MVFNATFNNISVTCISWQSVLLVEETGVGSHDHDDPCSTQYKYYLAIVGGYMTISNFIEIWLPTLFSADVCPVN